MKQWFKRSYHVWDHFWFGPQRLYFVGWTRIVLCGMMTYNYTFRLSAIGLYGADSWILRDQALRIFPEAIRPPFAWFFWPDSWNYPVHVILIASLFLLTLGIGGRPLTWLAWVLDMGFLQRNFSINFGADVTGSLFLFYLCFVQSTQRMSILNFFFPERKKKMADLFSRVGIRLLQIQLCVIYTYTGFEKLKGSTWWDGTAVWGLFGNPQMVLIKMDFMRHFPLLVVAATYGTLLFEIFFVPGILAKQTRPFWLWCGVFFHLTIAVVVGLLPFSAVMLSLYFLFLPQDKEFVFQGCKEGVSLRSCLQLKKISD